MTSLKLIERKVPKEKIAMLSIPMIPVKIIITIFLTRQLLLSFFKFFQDSKFTKQSSSDRQFTQLMKFILKSSTNNEISDRRFTVGPRPMNVFLISYPARLILCLLLVLLVFVTPM